MTIEPLVITSTANDRIKAIRALEMRKVRKETGLFVAEGTSLLVTARENGFAPKTIVYQTGTAASGITRGLVASAAAAGADIIEVSEMVLRKVAAKDNPQTMLGVFEQRFQPSPNPRDVDKCATWLALETIRDPGNLGTIIRTADAVGCAGIILVGACCDPFAPETVRASMGSIFSVPIVRLDLPAFLALAHGWPGDVIATHLKATDDFRNVAYRGPQLLVMGSEGPGLSDAAFAAAHTRIKIPMSGQLDSLNLAVATALALYQIRGPLLKI